jgi:acetoin:2,6-dichlorophenolindophenol oxidoreductase subunit beta
MTANMTQLTYLQAIGEAQREEMRRDDKIFLMGQDIRANVFGALTGFVEEFGEERVRNVPLSEAAFVGAAVGAAMVGMRPIVDITISSFFYVAMDQIVSMAAKATYMYGGQTKVPLVLRSAMFYAGGMAAQHSDRPYPMFMTVPGLKIIIPSDPYDAKGLLKTAIRDDNPVMTFEDSLVWGVKSDIPDEEYLIPFGQAAVKREGSDVTVIALGSRVQMALTAAEAAAREGISVEVIDPRTLVPLDKETILKSVAKTGRVITMEIAHRTCGAGAEIAAIIAEEGFWNLKAPVKRLAVPDVHIPFSPPLEPQFYPDVPMLSAAIRAVME